MLPLLFSILHSTTFLHTKGAIWSFTKQVYYIYILPRYRSGAVTQDVVTKQEAGVGTPNNVVSVAPVETDDDESEEAQDDDVEDDEDLPEFDTLFPTLGKPASGGSAFGVVRNQLSTRAWAKSPPRYVRENYNRYRSGYYRADEEEDEEEPQDDDGDEEDDSFIPNWNEMFPKLPANQGGQGGQAPQAYQDRPVRRRPSLFSSLRPALSMRRPVSRVPRPTPVQRYRYSSEETESNETPQYRQMPIRNVQVVRQPVSYRPMPYYQQQRPVVRYPVSYRQPVYVQRPMMNYNRRQYSVVGGRRVQQTQRRPVVYNFVQYGNRRRPMMRRRQRTYTPYSYYY